jgi:hypothetical protein
MGHYESVEDALKELGIDQPNWALREDLDGVFGAPVEMRCTIDGRAIEWRPVGGDTAQFPLSTFPDCRTDLVECWP